MTAPVMQLAWDQARKAITLAISPGWAARASRVVAPSASVRAGAAPLVRTGPAAMALTRTPAGLNSAAQERVIAARVALVAL
jgi:hypothetical protein